jgi:hypothetical protein
VLSPELLHPSKTESIIILTSEKERKPCETFNVA